MPSGSGLRREARTAEKEMQSMFAILLHVMENVLYLKEYWMYSLRTSCGARHSTNGSLSAFSIWWEICSIPGDGLPTTEAGNSPNVVSITCLFSTVLHLGSISSTS